MLTREIIHTELQPSLAEFKNHLRITSSDLDAELLAKLKAAIAAAEHEVGMVIAKSNFTYSGKFAPSIQLEYPAISAVSVEVDGATIPEGSYELEENALTFAADITGSRVKIQYVAGKEQVEYDIRAAILLYAAKLFNNPVDTVATLPTQSANLLRPYRSWGHRNGNKG